MQQNIGDLLVSRGPRLERRQQASYLTDTTLRARPINEEEKMKKDEDE